MNGIPLQIENMILLTSLANPDQVDTECARVHKQATASELDAVM